LRTGAHRAVMPPGGSVLGLPTTNAGWTGFGAAAAIRAAPGRARASAASSGDASQRVAEYAATTTVSAIPTSRNRLSP
jgi:hypothetical protein